MPICKAFPVMGRHFYQQRQVNTAMSETNSVIEGNRVLDFTTPSTPESRQRVHNHFLNVNPYGHLTEEQRETVRRAWQARVNARKSTGPRTEEGKQISAQNARKHGYASARVVLLEEDQEAYDLHLDSYFQSFRPVTQVECDYVRRIADAQWRLDRLCSIETGLLDLEYNYVRPFADVIFDPNDIQYHHYLAIAFLEKVNSDKALDLCRRYQSAASRDADRAIKMFLTLKAERIKDEKAAVQPAHKSQKTQSVPNEPTPAPQHPAKITPIRPANSPKPGQEGHAEIRRSQERR